MKGEVDSLEKTWRELSGVLMAHIQRRRVYDAEGGTVEQLLQIREEDQVINDRDFKASLWVERISLLGHQSPGRGDARGTGRV